MSRLNCYKYITLLLEFQDEDKTQITFKSFFQNPLPKGSHKAKL